MSETATSPRRPSLTVDSLTLNEGDLLLDTRTTQVKRFVGVEDRQGFVRPRPYALFETGYSLTHEHACPEAERDTAVQTNIKYERYLTPSDFPLPVAEYAAVGDWHLNHLTKETTATWTNGTYTLTVGKGYETATKADYGVALSRPKIPGKGPTSAGTVCLARGDSFEAALEQAVVFMENVSIPDHGDDAHAYDYFVTDRDTGRQSSDTIAQGDVIEYKLFGDVDSCVGENMGLTECEYCYRGEVVSVRDDTAYIRRYCSFNIFDTVSYDRITAVIR